MKKSLIVDIISCLLILLFLYTGISKLTAIKYFTLAMEKSPPIHDYASILVWAVPIVELAISLALAIPLFKYRPQLRKGGLYASAILMLLFTIYVGIMLKTLTHLPCSCGGIISLMNWHQHLYFNTVFTCLALIAIWLDRKSHLTDETYTLAR